MQKCFTQRGFVVTTTVQPCPPAHKLVRIWMCNRDGGDYWMGRQLPETFSFLSVLHSSLIVFSRIPASACWSVSSAVSVILAAQSPEWMAGFFRSSKPQSIMCRSMLSMSAFTLHVLDTSWMLCTEMVMVLVWQLTPANLDSRIIPDTFLWPTCWTERWHWDGLKLVCQIWATSRPECSQGQANELELAKVKAIIPRIMRAWWTYRVWARSEPQQFTVMEVRDHCFNICGHQTSW